MSLPTQTILRFFDSLITNGQYSTGWTGKKVALVQIFKACPPSSSFSCFAVQSHHSPAGETRGKEERPSLLWWGPTMEGSMKSVQGKETRNAHRALTCWWISSMPVLRQLIRMSTWHQEIQVTAGQEVWALRASCCAWLDPRAGTRPLSWWQRTPDTVRLLRKSSWEGWGSTCRCTACKQAVPLTPAFPL